MNNKSKKYLLIVGPLRFSILRAVDTILSDKLYPDIELVVLTRQTSKSETILDKYVPKFKVQIIECKFEKDELEKLIVKYKDQIVGVSCRGDKQIQDLRRLVVNLPESVYVSSERSLTVATNKRLMRQAFNDYSPEITPKHIKASSNIGGTIAEAESEIGYPLIVKPANLASSLLIQSCHNRSELETALTKVYNVIYGIYEQEERLDSPEVIIEEYLEGDFYSIDAYVLDKDEVYYCPPVSYIPAKQIGVDDFFLFKRFMPTKLSSEQIKEANKVCKLAINAVGLKYASAHVELVLTKNGWRIIELGPRLGRFRDHMYDLAYGIEHSLNDIKLHLGIKPQINTELKEYTAAYSIYPFHEGKLTEIKGVDFITNSKDVRWRKFYGKAGDSVKFAKHGGHSLAEFIVSTKDKTAFDSLTKKIEAEVYADIETD